MDLASRLNHVPHTAPSPADLRQHADETPHRRMDALAWTALGLGLAAFVIAWASQGSLWGVAVGVVGFFVALVAQMFSATTSERWLIMPGWTLSFIGALMNLFYLYS